MSNSNTPSSSVVLKAGLWYTISNFLFRGMAFITTPLFARLLTKSEYGKFSNFAAWMSILSVITAWDLHTSIIRSKLEFEDDLDSYIHSILCLSSVITAICYIICLLFSDYIFTRILYIEKKYIHLMFFYLFVAPAFNIYITKSRAFYKYKNVTKLTAISMGISTICSIILVLVMDDKLLGRIIGQYVPIALLSLCIYITIVAKGRRVNFSYWKYAITISLPLVPHLLSMYILSSSDRILITNISGVEYTAIYSVAFSCAQIVSVLLDSMNKAWAPWFLDNLHEKEYSKIKKVTIPYYLLFIVLASGVLLLAPEIIFVLGGKSYADAKYVLPPLVVGCVFQFAYTMYVQVEFYERKTVVVAIGTALAASINLVLNIVFIPIYGYVAAAYTTLIGYLCLFLFHYIIISRLGYKDIFDRKILFGGLLFEILFMYLMIIIYDYNIVRWIIIIIYSILVSIVLLLNRKKILNLLKV